MGEGVAEGQRGDEAPVSVPSRARTVRLSPPSREAKQVYTSSAPTSCPVACLPGTKLRFADLTDRYDCSTSVVREGLTRLAEQGLVQAEPQHGFHVTPLSQDDLDDLTTARCELEGLVLRMSIEHGDIAWESEIVAAHHALDRTAMETDGDPVRDERGVDACAFALSSGAARGLPESTAPQHGAVAARRGRAVPTLVAADRPRRRSRCAR